MTINKIFFLKIISVLFSIIISYIFIFNGPRDVALNADNEYTKTTMEKYIKENNIKDYSVGTNAWNHYINTVVPKGELIRKNKLRELIRSKIFYWSIFVFLISFIPIWGYIYSLYFNALLLLLVGVGYGDILFMLPVFVFLCGVYLRDCVSLWCLEKTS